jgi:3-hydroxyacyl-[acyl-carrier-protein] dehydratase
MLLNDFFRIDDLAREDQSAKASLTLNPGHPVFGGHFPSQPVVPGACLLQMVQDMVAVITGREWLLIKADHCKFIAMIDPRINTTLEMTVRYKETGDGQLEVSADLSREGAVCFKFRGAFRSV